MPHSQGPSNNSYAEPILRIDTISLRSILILSFHIRPGLSKDLFPAGVPVKIFKALLLSSILLS